MSRMSLDEIAAAAAERKRLDELMQAHGKEIAAMADEIERIKAEDWKPPFDEHEYTPEATVPDDWLLREAFAKAKAKEGLSEDMKTLADVVKHYTIETD